MLDWELSIGFYPGLVIGFREYDQGSLKDYVIYLPLVELCLTVYKD